MSLRQANVIFQKCRKTYHEDKGNYVFIQKKTVALINSLGDFSAHVLLFNPSSNKLMYMYVLTY